MLFSLVGIPLHLSCTKLKQNKKSHTKEGIVEIIGEKYAKQRKKPIAFTMHNHLPGLESPAPSLYQVLTFLIHRNWQVNRIKKH